MKNLPTYGARLVLCVIILIGVLTTPAVRADAPEAVEEIAARVNQERVTRGLAPLALNAKLTAAAQAHANDIAQTTRYSHTGADGSTATERVARAGYGTYSWGRRVGENWAHYHDVPAAMAMWMDSAPHRNNILHQVYREMGIGAAPTDYGFVYVIDFGAQPNALPIFINAGACETKSPDVKITLTDEAVAPAGDGATTMGHPTQVQISNTADFADAKWQPYATTLDWALSPGGGAKTIYVKYRDVKGRTALASAAITLGALATPTATKPPTLMLTPTRTRTNTSVPPRASATITVTLTPPAMETPTVTPTETLTATPTLTAVATPGSATPTLTATILAAPVSDAPTTSTGELAPLPDFGVLGLFGVTVMMSVFAIVKYLAER